MKLAVIAPQKARNEAIAITATVDPTALTMEPMNMDRMNCARKTMLLSMATSVPRPRSCVPTLAWPSAVASNWWDK